MDLNASSYFVSICYILYLVVHNIIHIMRCKSINTHYITVDSMWYYQVNASHAITHNTI